MGYVNYYRKFIGGYGKMTAPLTNLTKKDVGFKWTDGEDRAFQLIKEAVLSEPVLVEPDPGEPFEMDVDASGYAMGG